MKSTFHNISLNEREAMFFDYLYKKMSQKHRNYVNTNYYYIKNVTKYTSMPGARYLVKNLVKKKLITVQEGINWTGKQYLKIKIAKPRVIKKFLEAYKAQESREREDAGSKSTDDVKTSKTTLLNNNNIINQINHLEEKKKTTIVQDMLQAYNEITNGTVTPSRELAPMLVAAYKQKFKTIERWRQYLKHEIWGKIRNTFQFLKKILAFSIINAAMGEMGMNATFLPKYTAEAAYNHVNTLKESPVCLEVRKKFIEREGAEFYFSWLTRTSLIEQDGKILVKGESSFVTDWISTRYNLEIERYYNELKDNHFNHTDKNHTDKMIENTQQQEEIHMEAMGQVVGHVGSCEVKEGKKGKVMKLSVSHTEISKKEDGTYDSKTTWYQVYYTGDKRIEYLGDIQKGDVVIVRGDLRTLNGIRQDGTPYTAICIMAEKVKRLAKAKSVAKV